MKLYERLEYMNASPAGLAGNFAEYVRHDPAANRAEIGRELSAILERRAQLAADLERIAEEMGEKRKAWQDFADIPGTPQPNKGAQLANIEADNAARAEAESVRVEVEAVISALDLLFCEICRALDFEGLSITSGEISALKRNTIPQRLAVEMDTIKRVKIATIPQAERLNVEDAAALYENLTRAGLISGPLEAFIYHLGQVTQGKQKAPGEGLKWTGNKAEFAYFARLFSEFTQPGGMGQPYIREKALCRAFGFDDRQRVNTIRPYLSDQHKPRTSAKIEAAFAAAGSAKNEALEASTQKKL